MIYAFVFLISTFSSFVQAVTGFGAAVIMLLFFSFFMPVMTVTALSGAMCIASNVSNSVTYRRQIRWKLLPIPVLIYFVVSYFGIRLAQAMDTVLLKRIFGAVLVILAVYFLFFAKKIRIRATTLSSVICGVISGVTGGMFGASGPPMVVYILAATDTKESYIGTTQMFCLLTGLWALGVRIFTGYYTFEMIPMIVVGVLGILVGQFIGVKVVRKISVETLHTSVYVMLAISGVMNLLM